MYRCKDWAVATASQHEHIFWIDALAGGIAANF
jgi:hypothetical protein